MGDIERENKQTNKQISLKSDLETKLHKETSNDKLQ